MLSAFHATSHLLGQFFNVVLVCHCLFSCWWIISSYTKFGKLPAETSTAIADYIWGYYQTVRPHRFNNYLSPLEKEKRYFNQNLLSVVLN
jgi:transposase InsO family protein